MERLPISAVLIVKDGERHLDRVLAALDLCDEILVLDSGSSDRTCSIARARGARVEHQDFLGYGPQKRRAIELARHDWVLVVDDDEVLDEDARSALRAFDRADASRCGRFRRITYIGGQAVRHGVFGAERTVRLLNRSRSRMGDQQVHEAVESDGPVVDLGGAIHHHSFRDAADLFARLAQYARPKAERYRAEGRSAGSLLLLARFTGAFLKCWLLKGGFRDGRLGLLVALSAACDAVVALGQASLPESASS